MQSALQLAVIYVVTGFGALLVTGSTATVDNAVTFRRFIIWPAHVVRWLNREPLYRAGRHQLSVCGTYAVVAAALNGLQWSQGQAVAPVGTLLAGVPMLMAIMMGTQEPPASMHPPRDQWSWHWAVLLMISIGGATAAFVWAPSWGQSSSGASVAGLAGWGILVFCYQAMRDRLPFAYPRR